MKTSLQSFTLTTAFTLTLMGSFSAPMQLQAEPISPRSGVSLGFTPPPPPPDRGAPGNRGEGASRGCTTGRHPLTALVPSYEQTLNSTPGDASTITQVWGLTSAEHPSFWFYVPYDSASVGEMEFVLQNEQNETIYRTPASIPSKAGIVRVPLPTTATPLEAGKRYHWFFKVRVSCDPNQAISLDYVEGWVERISLDAALTNRLNQASPQQRAELYGENGIWHDALATIAELRLANPNDGAIARNWTALLEAVGLENLANQPLLE